MYSKCTDREKPFRLISDFFRANLSQDPKMVLSDLDPTIQVYYTDMYGSVRNLCTQVQLDYFDSVFK